MGNVFLLTSRTSKGLLNERCYRLVRIHHHGVHADARQVPNPLLDNHVPDVHVATVDMVVVQYEANHDVVVGKGRDQSDRARSETVRVLAHDWSSKWRS